MRVVCEMVNEWSLHKDIVVNDSSIVRQVTCIVIDISQDKGICQCEKTLVLNAGCVLAMLRQRKEKLHGCLQFFNSSPEIRVLPCCLSLVLC